MTKYSTEGSDRLVYEPDTIDKNAPMSTSTRRAYYSDLQVFIEKTGRALPVTMDGSNSKSGPKVSLAEHIYCSFHPKYSIGKVIRKFKSITARELFRRLPELKKELWGGEFLDGYYASTVGEDENWSVVKKHVHDQGKNSKEEQLRLL